MIDGVIFQFEQGGKKLARIGGGSILRVTSERRPRETDTRRTFTDRPDHRNWELGCGRNADTQIARVWRSEVQKNESGEFDLITVKVRLLRFFRDFLLSRPRLPDRTALGDSRLSIVC